MGNQQEIEECVATRQLKITNDDPYKSCYKDNTK